MVSRHRRSFTRMLASLAIAVSAAGVAPSVAFAQPGASRAVEPFEAVSVRGPVEVVLRQGREPGLWVQAGDADPALLLTRVIRQGGRATLEIEFKPPRGLWHRAVPKVQVDWVQLSAVSLQGPADLRADGVATPALAVRVQGSGTARLQRVVTESLAIALAGSGDVVAQGRSQRLTASLAGSGDIEAAELAAEVVEVSIAGSGDVEVNATQALQARIAGSGDLRYRGAAQVQSRVAGSGTITRF